MMDEEYRHTIYKIDEEYTDKEKNYVMRMSICSNDKTYIQLVGNHLSKAGIDFKMYPKANMLCLEWESVRKWHFDVDNLI